MKPWHSHYEPALKLNMHKGSEVSEATVRAQTQGCSTVTGLSYQSVYSGKFHAEKEPGGESAPQGTNELAKWLQGNRFGFGNMYLQLHSPHGIDARRLAVAGH
jgi:hypothetical protein